MNETVRPTESRDLGWFVEFDRAQRLAALDQRGGPEMVAAWPTRSHADWQTLLNEPTAALFTAEIDAQPVGYAVSQLRADVVVVERIFVEAGFRELGLGDAMLEALMAWGRACDAQAIEALALPGDRETKNMFERYGVKARALIVRASLNPALDDRV
jgi:GNAT superfamily N-acetyltransferase